MLDFLLPIVLFLLPVLAVVGLTVGRGKELTGSCGGMSPDGRCTRCGKAASEMPKATDPAHESCSS